MLVILVMVFIVMGASSAFARPFPITDVRGLGMGGSFVASGKGISAVNYNPALLGQDITFQTFAPNIIARIEDHIGLDEVINDLNDSGITTTSTIALLNRLDQGGAVDIEAYGAVGVGFSALGIGVGITYADMISGTAFPANIDTTTIPPVATNTNTIEFSGIEAKQIILTGAVSFGNISVGANIRNIDATIYTESVWIYDDPDLGVGEVTTGTEQSKTAVAYDVGAVINLTPMLDVAVVGRDITKSDLDVVGFEFEPRYRLGVAINLPTLTISADYDLTEDTSVSGTKYREWAIGGEFDVWAIALRTGLSRNTGIDGTPTLIHFGLGFGFLDIGFAYGEEGDYYIAGLNLGFGI
jgi:hypothetical protein